MRNKTQGSKKAKTSTNEGRFTLRLGRKLIEEYKARAGENCRSVSGEMIHVLRNGVKTPAAV